MTYEVSGMLIEKYPVVEVSGKFKKREFVISKTETNNGFEFTDFIKFQLTQDRCNLIEPFDVNTSIKVSFNLRGRKWEKDGTVSYFTNLEAWKIENNVGLNPQDQSSTAKKEDIPFPGADDFSPSLDEDSVNDLPF